MSPLSTNDLIQINATVIVGLLILLTLNFIGSDLNAIQRDRLADIKSENTIESNTLKGMLLDQCDIDVSHDLTLLNVTLYKNKTSKDGHLVEHCLEQYYKWSLIQYEMQFAIPKSESALKQGTESQPLNIVSKSGGVFAQFLIIPFALSAIIEAIVSRKTDGKNSSKIAYVIMIIGFGLIALVLSMDAIIDSYFTLSRE